MATTAATTVAVNDAAATSSASEAALLASWRTNLAVRSRRKNESELVLSTHYQVPDESKYVTCMAVSNVEPFLAVGSGGSVNNLFLLTDKQAAGGRSRVIDHVSTFTNPKPIYSLTWAGNVILAGCADGIVNHFQIDYAALKSGQRVNAGLKCMAQYAHNVKNPVPMSPGSYIYTSRVTRLEFAAQTQTFGQAGAQFLTLVGSSLHVWDTSSTKAPVRCDKIAHDANMAACWSPHAPYSLIAAGGIDKAVVICDPRKTGKTMIWKARSAHAGIVRDIRWHPFLPYWIASAGDDSAVHIWDIRSNTGPVARIDAHHNSVQSLAWSNSNADMLSTGSADRSWRLWTLKAGLDAQLPVNPTADADIEMQVKTGSAVVGALAVADRRNGYTGSVCAVLASSLARNVFYGVSFMGELCAHVVTPELTDMLAPHRCDPKDSPLEAEVERAVHNRDFDAAYSALLRWSREQENFAKTARITALAGLCRINSPVEPTAWSVSTPSRRATSQRELARQAPSTLSLTHTNVSRFREELDKWSRLFPPGFNPKLGVAASPQLVEDMDKLMLKLNVRKLVDAGEWERLIAMEKDVFACLDSSSSNILDWLTLKEVVELILQHDRTKGVLFGLRIAAICEVRRRFSEMCPLIRMLLHPTVFDPDPDVREDKSPPPPLNPHQHHQQAAAAARPAESNESVAAAPPSAPRPPDAGTSSSLKSLAVPANAAEPAPASRSPAGGRSPAGSPVASRRPMRRDPFEKLMQNPQLILGMVRLGITVEKIFSRDGESVDEDVIAAMQGQKTISQNANKAFLDALVNTRRYDEYMITAMELMGTYASYDFARNILSQITTAVAPRLKKHLEIITFTVQRDPLGLEPDVYRETLMQIVRIAQQCGGEVPGLEPGTLPNFFKQIANGFFLLLDSYITKKKPANASKEAHQVVQALARASESKKSNYMLETIDNLGARAERYIQSQ